MDLWKIEGFEDLKTWLEGKPPDWAQIIAIRSVLRTIPALGYEEGLWLRRFTPAVVRAIFISWAARSFPAHDMSDAAVAAAYFAVIPRNQAKRYVADAAAYSAFAANSVTASRLAASPTNSDAARAVNYAVSDFDDWQSVRNDCDWLLKRSDYSAASRAFTRRSLWLGRPSKSWQVGWISVARKLRKIDSNYDVWIDWYERRIRGERAAFDIPGDKRRVEDKKILIRLAEATEEEFWGKGHEYVNAALKGWLDEARARVAGPPPADDIAVPPQQAGAIAYGVDKRGKLDRLPHRDQKHLRDEPDQRRAYRDLRKTANELNNEGQRLGPRLRPALSRFTRSLPARFADAEAYLVWRDGNALRRIHRAHREAAKGSEPDDAKLEPVIAEELGGLLDLFNNFAFGDDGIRAKDEARISPQERESASTEFAAAKPLVEAILATPEIATRQAHDDIAADAENADLPADDPYAGQAQDQANHTRRNWIAGLLEGARNAANNPKLLGKRVTIGVATGAGTAMGAVLTKSAFGLSHAPLLEFIATNATVLQSYVAVAFGSFPHLPDLIDRIAGLWNRIKNL